MCTSQLTKGWTQGPDAGLRGETGIEASSLSFGVKWKACLSFLLARLSVRSRAVRIEALSGGAMAWSVAVRATIERKGVCYSLQGTALYLVMSYSIIEHNTLQRHLDWREMVFICVR